MNIPIDEGAKCLFVLHVLVVLPVDEQNLAEHSLNGFVLKKRHIGESKRAISGGYSMIIYGRSFHVLIDAVA
jgi:hypothetical protein